MSVPLIEHLSAPASPPRRLRRGTLQVMLKLAGLLAISAMAVVGACCAALLKDVPDELPHGTSPTPAV